MCNTFTARGITKEGIFVIGYYFFCGLDEKHYIIKQAKKDSIMIIGEHPITQYQEYIEIIQEPDRCLGVKDIEEELIFERDDVEEEYGVDYTSNMFPSFVDGTQDKKRLIVQYNNGSFNVKIGKWYKHKIIHPTNKKEIESRL